MCEPASAAPIAGLLKLNPADRDLDGQMVVVILTGHGLKDPATALSLLPEPAAVEPTVEAVSTAMGHS